MKYHRKSKRGGEGWCFDHLSLDELLQMQREAIARDRTGDTTPPDQHAALAEAILKAREKPQEMQLKIAGATTFVKVPHAK